MLGGCCTRPKGSTRMGHGTSPKGRVSTHSCRLPLCHPVCPTVHTYQHVRTHSGDAITGRPPLCSFRPFFSPAFAALSPSFSFSLCPCYRVRIYACTCMYVCTFSLSLSLSPSFFVLCYFTLYFSSLFLLLFLYLILSSFLSLYSWLLPLLFSTFALSFSADPISPSLCLHSNFLSYYLTRSFSFIFLLKFILCFPASSRLD